MCISSPLDPSEFITDEKLFEESYKIFEKELRLLENRPQLLGENIYIDCKDFADDGKELSYWHICSIGADDSKFDMYPCLNDTVKNICQYQCEVEHEENFLKDRNSIPCLYRASKIFWIKEIIELANQDQENENIRIWKTKDKQAHDNLLIRYVTATIDYVIIFVIQKPGSKYLYRLKTAFPIVLKSYKKRYDREYLSYQKAK